MKYDGLDNQFSQELLLACKKDFMNCRNFPLIPVTEIANIMLFNKRSFFIKELSMKCQSKQSYTYLKGLLRRINDAKERGTYIGTLSWTCLNTDDLNLDFPQGSNPEDKYYFGSGYLAYDKDCKWKDITYIYDVNEIDIRNVLFQNDVSDFQPGVISIDNIDEYCIQICKFLSTSTYRVTVVDDETGESIY